jgi:hypothetical protein
MSSRVIIVMVLVLALLTLGLPAVAGGNISCPYPGQTVKTEGYSTNWATHGHHINGWVTYRSGVHTSVIHSVPPARQGLNSWDVTNVIWEDADCYPLAV